MTKQKPLTGTPSTNPHYWDDVVELGPEPYPAVKVTDHQPSWEDFHKDAVIDLTAKLRPQPVAISIGEHTFGQDIHPSVFGTYGDYSCIVGSSKSKKTFLKSALIAGYIGGQSVDYFPNIKGHDTDGKWIIDIDTEQGEYDSQRTFKRVPKMVGKLHPKYVGISLRRNSPKERFEYLEWLFTKSPYVGNIGLVSIDGYADLISDFNSLEQSNELTHALLRWSHDQNCHITGILHKNFGSEKPVGHIGSSVLKKACSVVFTEQDTGPDGQVISQIITVNCKYSRSYPFDKFAFSINNEHLPTEEDLII